MLGPVVMRIFFSMPDFQYPICVLLVTLTNCNGGRNPREMNMWLLICTILNSKLFCHLRRPLNFMKLDSEKGKVRKGLVYYHCMVIYFLEQTMGLFVKDVCHQAYFSVIDPNDFQPISVEKESASVQKHEISSLIF